MNRSDFLSNMGERIVERRKYMNLSQEELAEKADVSPQLLSTAERGSKALRPENLLKISRALNVSADFLLTGEIIDKDFAILQRKMEKATQEQIRIIEKILDQCINLCN